MNKRLSWDWLSVMFKIRLDSDTRHWKMSARFGAVQENAANGETENLRGIWRFIDGYLTMP